MCQSNPEQELRERFVEQVWALDAVPGQFQEDPSKLPVVLDKIEKLCELVVRNAPTSGDPVLRAATLGAIEGGIRSAVEMVTREEPFARILVPYIKQKIALREMVKEPGLSVHAPRIVLRALIVPGDKTKEGVLIDGVTRLWFDVLKRIRVDPERIHDIDWPQWEEIIAGAYKQEGWETVILTPRSGDKGRDIIAQRGDWGQIRFLLLDQVKAYGPDELIGPDQVREMAGVLLREPNATKAIITTTSEFTRGAIEEATYLMPRLELKPRGKLLAWLASVAATQES